MTGFGQDVRYSFRMLAKTRGFTAIAVATLALGIGANSAILILGGKMFYRTLPYKDPNRLVVLWGKDLKRGRNTTYSSTAEVTAWRERADSFESISASTWTDYGTFAITGAGGAERVRGVAVLPQLFETLRERPLAGRGFLPEEFIGDKRVVLIDYKLWQSRFGGDRDVVGKTIRINREPYEVVGILPSDFELPVLDDAAQILLPLRLDSAEAQDGKERLLFGFGRLKPARTAAQAQTELEAIAAQLARENPDDAGYSVNVQNLRDASGLHDAQEKLPMFLWTVSLLLFIAAANVAGILLSRFAARQPELILRNALGASRRRLVRQLLTESLMLSLLAAVLAVGVALWTSDVVLAYKPFYMPFELHSTLDWTTVLTILGVSLAIGLTFGIVPAMTVSRTNLNEAMNRSGMRGGAPWWRDQTRNALLVGEVGLSVALLAGTALMVNTLVKISQVNIGFNPDGLTVSRIALDRTRYPSEANQAAFYRALVDKLGSSPGVTAATAASHFCNYDPSGWCIGDPVRVPGNAATEKSPGSQTVVMAGFFSAIGMPILRGREFNAHESMPVMIVDETFADRFFPNQDPIGQQVELLRSTMTGDEEIKPGLRTIIGVVPVVRRIAYWAKPFPQAYVPFEQNPVPAMFAVIRTRDGAGESPIRAAVSSLDSDLPVYRVNTMKDWITRFYASQRFEMLVLGVFSAIALLISASGLYAVISHRVTQRTREIGVRLALGAKRSDVEWVVLQQAAMLIGGGIAAGIGAASVLGKLISKLVFGVRPQDPATLAAAAGLVLLISMLAVYLPARRAAKMDPLTALRAD